MKNSEVLERGDQVIYVPDHAKGDVTHPDCEKGFVTTDQGEDAFVRYFSKDMDRSDLLRTKANSERTPKRLLIRQKHHTVRFVESLMEEYCDRQ